jgi:hypothetical protein
MYDKMPPERVKVSVLRRGRGYLSREACARSVTSTPPGLVDDALAVRTTLRLIRLTFGSD